LGEPFSTVGLFHTTGFTSATHTSKVTACARQWKSPPPGSENAKQKESMHSCTQSASRLAFPFHYSILFRPKLSRRRRTGWGVHYPYIGTRLRPVPKTHSIFRLSVGANSRSRARARTYPGTVPLFERKDAELYVSPERGTYKCYGLWRVAAIIFLLLEKMEGGRLHDMLCLF